MSGPLSLTWLHCICAESIRSKRAEWVAAATLLQGAVRRWLDRRALVARLGAIRRGVAGLRALQAAWRGRPLRSAFLRQRSATITVQVRLEE